MASIITEDFEGGTAGGGINASNTAAAATSGSPVFSATAFTGALAAFLPGAGSHTIRFDHAPASDAWYAVALQVDAIPTSHAQILAVEDGATRICDVQVGANSGVLRLRNGTVLTASTTIALSPGTWYQLALRIRPGVGLALRLYNADGTLLDDITGASTNGAAANILRLATTAAAGGTYFDWLRADNATEPTPHTATAPTTSSVFTAGGWVPTRRRVL